MINLNILDYIFKFISLFFRRSYYALYEIVKNINNNINKIRFILYNIY